MGIIRANWGPLFLSTPSARRATAALCDVIMAPHISIHALREEGDLPQAGPEFQVSAISIHALREEGDPEWCPPPALPS